MGEIEDIKKLPPEERIKKLKEIAERNKKEIEEAKKLMSQSAEEVDARIEDLKKIRVPEIEEVNIEQMFKKREEGLEDTVAKEKPRISEEEMGMQAQYFHELGTVELANIKQNIYEQKEQQGYINQEQQQSIYNINQELGQRAEDIEKGSYQPSNKRVLDILGFDEEGHKKDYRAFRG